MHSFFSVLSTDKENKQHIIDNGGISLILRNKENKELVQSFCLPFELKNADAMFCMRYFSKS